MNERIWEDPGFHVVITNESRTYCAFDVFKIIGKADSGKCYYYERKGATSSGDWVDTIEEAGKFLHCSIKWDGCSDWHFDEQDDCMIHFCGKNHMKEMHKLMDMLYDLAEELMADYGLKVDRELFDG
jgi:hypothetical protein